MKDKCVLYDRDCIDCGECEFCDLDPTKLCDNCGKCIENFNMDYASIKIDGIVDESSEKVCASEECDCHGHHRH